MMKSEHVKVSRIWMHRQIFPAIDPDAVTTIQELLDNLRGERETIEERFGQLSQELVRLGFIPPLTSYSPCPRIQFSQ